MRTLRSFALALILALASRAPATTFVVDDTGEGGDANPGDGVCDTGAGKCTLVAAMQEANALVGADIIQVTPGTYTFTATLPTVTTVMTIEPTTGTDPSATVIQSSNTGHPRLFNLTAGGDLTLDSLTLENAQTFYGSALQATSASATLTNCVVTNNTATAIYVTSNSSLTLTDSTISNNASGLGSPGGIWVDFSNVTATNTTFSGNSGGLGGAGYLYTASDNTHTLSFSGCTFTGNSSNNSGGALSVGSDTVTIDGSTFTNNTTSYPLYGGGAIYTDGLTPGTVITNSTFTGNQATAASGGHGGAIFVLNLASCRGCTFSGNSATADGGAVFAGANSGAEFDAVDSTFSGNTAFGGGALGTSETMKLASVTITDNTATAAHGTSGGNGATGGGGGTNGINIRARNTIVAGNHSATSPDCDGQIFSLGYDLVGVGNDTNCSVTASTGNQVGTGGSPIDPGLDVLADNGGPTETCALLASSPAGEAGDPTGCTDNAGAALATDQRGQPRAIDGNSDGIARCDIGAYEAPMGTFPTPTTTTTAAATTTTTTIATTTTTVATTTTAPPTTTTTSSTTTTAAPATTTTTLAAACAGTPEAATFASIICRFEDLLDMVGAAGSELGSLGPKLTKVLTKGHDGTVQAQSDCAGGNAKHAKQGLKRVIRQVIQYKHDLSTLSARKKLKNDPSLRARLLAPADALKTNVTSLQHTVACPADAGS